MSVCDILTYLWCRRLPAYTTGGGSISGDDNRLVLSKGHSVPALYALASVTGQLSFEELGGFRKMGSRLQGHPDVSSIEWLETSTGSLGQGFSFGAGLALGKKLRNNSGQVFAVLGDGELQEGQVWETAMFASHRKLDNFVAIVDRNLLQSDSSTEIVMGLEPLEDKWRSFGWNLVRFNGHSFSEIESALALSQHSKQPTVLVADTVKGKGIDFMEGVPSWHGSVKITASQFEDGLKQLGVPDSEQEHIRELIGGLL